ncbi:MAG: hypothetical protein WC910_08560 [Bacteroidales bacterium]|jgi:translation initiation factor 2 beta subunit (eIF-2beta)/eIF-5
MTKEQKKRADELLAEIEDKKTSLVNLAKIAESIEEDNCRGQGMKIEGYYGWFFLKNAQFSLTFVAIAKAECEQQIKDLEAEFAAL